MAIKLEGLDKVQAAFGRLSKNLQGSLLDGVSQAAYDDAYASIGKHDKRSTGRLLSSLQHNKRHGVHEIGHDIQRAPHAVYLHFGTGEWGAFRKKILIKAKKKKALRWPVGVGEGSGFAFARFVETRGVKPDPWLERAKDAAMEAFPDVLRRIDQRWP